MEVSDNRADNFLSVAGIDVHRKTSGEFLIPEIIPTTVKKYDPYDFGKSEDETPQWGTICHIFVVSTGAGLLTIPGNFVAVDYVIGSVVIFLVLRLYVHCAQMALWSEYEICKMIHEPYLPNLGEVFVVLKNGKLSVRLLATIYRFLSYLAFVAAWFGYSCYNYHIISRNVQIFGNQICEHTFNNVAILGFLFPALLFLCCIRTLRQLIPFSLAGSIFNVTSFLLVVYCTAADPSPWQLKRNFGPVDNLAILAGSVLNDINGFGMLMLFKNELKHPKHFTSRFGVLNKSFITISCFYVAYVLICCLKYGINVRGNVFKNLPDNQLASQLTILCGIMGQIFQFPLIMFVPFDTIWNGITRQIKNHQRFCEYSLRIALVSAAFVITASIPRASLILSFFGAICASIEILLIPPIVETLVVGRTCENRFDFVSTVLKNMLLIGLAFWLVISQTIAFIGALSSKSISEGSAFWIHSSVKSKT